MIKTGSICLCSNKILGIVLRSTTNILGSTTYHGLNFDGYPWQSKNPQLIAENLNSYLENIVGTSPNYYDPEEYMR